MRGNDLLHFLMSIRASGTTTNIVETAKPGTTIVVARRDMVREFERLFREADKEPKDYRFMTLEDLHYAKYRGLRLGPVIFDTCALNQIAIQMAEMGATIQKLTDRNGILEERFLDWEYSRSYRA